MHISWEKVLSDGAVATAKKKGLIARPVARAYMLYILGSFLFPTKKGTDVSVRYLYLFAKDKVAKKWSLGSTVLAYIYYNLGTSSRDDGRQFTCCTTLLELWIFAYFPKLVGIPKKMDSDAYEHCTYWKWDIYVTDRYGEQIDLQLPPAIPPDPDVTLAKKYEDLLATHEDVKKKLIAKEDFLLLQEVWHQTLKKALASEGMGDMGDPTSEELFEQNKRFFTIAQQGPKGDYQEDLVSTAVTLENVIIAR
ncbi:hypothetical protein GIB67_043047, partial [Kingdonia uniflora]